MLAVVQISRQLKDLLLVQCSSSIPRDYGGLIGYIMPRAVKHANDGHALLLSSQDAPDHCAAIPPLPVAPRGAAR